jgi:hypothetical protein
MTAAKVRLAMAAMGQKETKVTDLRECHDFICQRNMIQPQCLLRTDHSISLPARTGRSFCGSRCRKAVAHGLQ